MQTLLKAATVEDFVRSLEQAQVPKGTQSFADYMRGKAVLVFWRAEVSRQGMNVPSSESCIRAIADWVGV